MKIKKFNESTEIGKEYWLSDYYILDDNTHYYKLHSDLESVESWIIEVINGERQMVDDDDDKAFFSDVKEALKWYEENFSDIKIGYQKIELEKYIPSEELQLKMKARKYNL